MMGWRDLSLMGSLVVTGPLGVAIALWLLAGRSWRLTLSWCMLFGAGMALVVLTKIAFIGWGVGVEALAFSGISGHAMRAAAVFPVALYLMLRRAGQRAGIRGALAGAALAALISIARVEVQAHSVSEAVTGTMLGLMVAAAFIRHAGSERHPTISRVLLALCIPVLLIGPRAEPAPTEQWMTMLALLVSGHDAPFTRRQWHTPPARKPAQPAPIQPPSLLQSPPSSPPSQPPWSSAAPRVFGQIPCVKWYDGLLVNGVSQRWPSPTRSGRDYLIRPHFYTAG